MITILDKPAHAPARKSIHTEHCYYCNAPVSVSFETVACVCAECTQAGHVLPRQRVAPTFHIHQPELQIHDEKKPN